MQALWWFMAVTACCSIFALYVAFSTSVRSRSTQHSEPSMRLQQLVLLLKSLEERCELAEASIKNLRSRLSMQDLRSKRAGAAIPMTEADPGSPGKPSELAISDDKAEIRRQLSARAAPKGV
jgi:hypothetical protein